MLNKNFYDIIKNLKTYKKIWKDKFVVEFSSNQDIKNGIIKHHFMNNRCFFELLNFIESNNVSEENDGKIYSKSF